MKGYLLLEDGKRFAGTFPGRARESWGEVVFNTGMCGYQEVISDPSYAGQIVVMSYPLIGNYGVNAADNESEKVYIKGLIVRELCTRHSNWRAEASLDDYLTERGIIVLEGIDTRALTRYLRSRGTMKGIITSDPDYNFAKLKEVEAEGLVERITPKEIEHIPGTGKKLVLVDFGIKSRILHYLREKNFDIYRVPASTGVAEIRALQPDGLFLSNGPGDPKEVKGMVETLQELMPIMPIGGICLGHQLIALALGYDTYKMKFGHRGINHPVKDLVTNRVYITSQNHGYAVNGETEQKDTFVSHINLNDKTVEGIHHRSLPIFSVQYHPEAAPGSEDSKYLFDEFEALYDDK